MRIFRTPLRNRCFIHTAFIVFGLNFINLIINQPYLSQKEVSIRYNLREKETHSDEE